jgi:hypothetical protein
MGERPTLCQWCRDDDPEGCERMGATCQDLRQAWERQPKRPTVHLHVDACDECPFFWETREEIACMHPEHLAVDDTPERKLTDNEENDLPEPPRWCPLRTADLVLTLEVER